MFYVLLMVLGINLFFAYNHFKIIVAPAVLVGGGMFLAALIASFYYEEWEMGDMIFLTFLLIGGGTVFFTMCCIFWESVLHMKIRIKPHIIHCDFFKEKRMVIFYTIVNIVTLWSISAKIAFLESLYGSYGLSILMGMSHDDEIYGSGGMLNLPILPRMAGNFSQVICYVSTWLLVIMLKSPRKNKILLFLVLTHFCLCIFNMMLNGSKGSMLTMPVVLCTIYAFFYYAKKGCFYIKRSFWVLLIVSLCSITIIFQGITILIGRGEDIEKHNSPADFIASYCGAEIKNLDIFLSRHPEGMLAKDFGANTFAAWYREHKEKVNTGTSDIYYEINGYQLGNVCTQFYYYYADFGVIGVFIMMIVLSFVSMFFYHKGMAQLMTPLNINVYLLIYAFMSLSLFMSFFSSKMTENFFRMGFLRTICYIILIVWFFKKILFKKQLK